MPLPAHRARLLALVIGVIGCLHTAAAAESEQRRRVFTVSPSTFEQLGKAQEYLSREGYAEAATTLDELSRRGGLNAHERALVQQTYASMEASRGNYTEAAAHLERCLAQNALPPAAALDVQYHLAQLYAAEERFARAAALLEEWFAKAENPSPPAYYLLAVAYMRQDKIDRALPPAREAVHRAPQPRESWMQLLLSLYLEKKDYPNARDLLKQLAARFPRKTYWTQLSAVCAELGDEEEALAVMELAYTQGLLTADADLRNLARMYLYRRIPYRAARLLEKGVADGIIEADAEAWELLADSWLSARENGRALEALERAAQLSGNGELYVRLGQLYVDAEEWPKAAEALRNALRQTDLQDRGQALVLLGIAELGSARRQAAKRAFERALEDASSRESAGRWLAHLEREMASR